jgi:formate hydrogenlyase subunit 3/multisubunit Na+/H+ antiporter MnhD subunit
LKIITASVFARPVLAFSLSLFMLSLLGLPLTAGFMGKVLVFRPALEAANPILTAMVIAAVINTAISALLLSAFNRRDVFPREDYRLARAAYSRRARRRFDSDGSRRFVFRYFR